MHVPAEGKGGRRPFVFGFFGEGAGRYKHRRTHGQSTIPNSDHQRHIPTDFAEHKRTPGTVDGVRLLRSPNSSPSSYMPSADEYESYW